MIKKKIQIRVKIRIQHRIYNETISLRLYNHASIIEIRYLP